jgi:hypothetical protein
LIFGKRKFRGVRPVAVEPTPEQRAQSARAQAETVKLFRRLADEGIDPPMVLAGVGAATAAFIQVVYGPAEVPQWFARNAVMTRDWSEIGKRL